MTGRRLFFTIVKALLLTGPIFVLLNLPYQYKYLGPTRSQFFNTVVDTRYEPPPPPVLAGWPWRYQIIATGNTSPNTQEVTRFSTLAVAYNLAIAILATGGVAVYLIYRRHRLTSSLANENSRRVTIADLFILTLVFSVPLGWWQSWKRHHRQQNRFVSELGDRGGAVMNSWAPAWLADYIPRAVAEEFQTIRAIRLEHPTGESLARCIDNANLQTVRIGGGSYSLKSLDALRRLPLLTEVRIAGRDLNIETVQMLATLTDLRNLNLSKTNVNAETLALLEDLPRLQSLVLLETPIQLHEFDDLAFGDTLQRLWLPRPNDPSEDSLKICGWGRLRELHVQDLDGKRQSKTLLVELRDLPELTTIGMGILQHYDLTLVNLPKATGIDQLDYRWRDRLSPGQGVPLGLWLSGLTMKSVGGFQNLEVHVVDLNRLQINDCPQIEKFSPLTELDLPNSTKRDTDLSKTEASTVINGLGRSDGPPVIELNGFPLADIDLSPLIANRGIRELHLQEASLTLDQVETISQMKTLKILDLSRAITEKEDIEHSIKVLDNVENLFFWSIRASGFQRYSKNLSIQIVDKPHLEFIDVVQEGGHAVDELIIRNAPRWSPDIHRQRLSKLDVRNAGLRRLVVSEPLKNPIVLADIPKLETLAIGGQAVTDDVLTVVLEAEDLKSLTIAYPDAGRESFMQLPLSNVECLSLPGCPIDDEVIQTWPEMPRLKCLNLSDTEVSPEGLMRLLDDRLLSTKMAPAELYSSRQTAQGVLPVPLVSLHVDRLKISSEIMTRLSEAKYLRFLSIAGTQPTHKQTIGLFGNTTLKALDLSNTRLESATLKWLINNEVHLDWLGLYGCKFDEDVFGKLLLERANLRFGLSWSDLSKEAAESFGLMRRDDQTGAISAPINGTFESRNRWNHGEPIDTRRFRPDHGRVR